MFSKTLKKLAVQQVLQLRKRDALEAAEELIEQGLESPEFSNLLKKMDKLQGALLNIKFLLMRHKETSMASSDALNWLQLRIIPVLEDISATSLELIKTLNQHYKK